MSEPRQHRPLGGARKCPPLAVGWRAMGIEPGSPGSSRRERRHCRQQPSGGPVGRLPPPPAPPPEPPSVFTFKSNSVKEGPHRNRAPLAQNDLFAETHLPTPLRHCTHSLTCIPPPCVLEHALTAHQHAPRHSARDETRTQARARIHASTNSGECAQIHTHACEQADMHAQMHACTT